MHAADNVETRFERLNEHRSPARRDDATAVGDRDHERTRPLSYGLGRSEARQPSGNGAAGSNALAYTLVARPIV